MITMISAIGMNNEIGKDNQLLWRIPEDLAFFKTKTLHQTIVMGEKTYQSIGKPLPNRKTIVLSTNPSLTIDGVTIMHSLEEVLELKEDLYIVGGGQIYKLFLPYADKLLLTCVDAAFDADTYFPAFEKDFVVYKTEPRKKAHELDYIFTYWKRK